MSIQYSNRISIYLAIILLSINYVSLAVDNFSADQQENLKYDQQLANNNNDTLSETYSRYNRQLDTDVENRFHINANTIIRTGESRVMGAKYVNETILPSNHDCLTRCLEVPNCNTAVYDEKNLHTCYMFDCGSPPKFLCKFTQHDSFVSSLLKITQHSYDLSQWGSQVKHEKELSELRTSEVQPSSSPSSVVLITSDAPVMKPKNLTQPENLCHHYQFKCLNSSECIAIYNVCDGIPQCPDGSDESPDLKCHEKTASKVSKTVIQRPVEPPHSVEHKVPKPKPVPKPPPPPSPPSPQNVQHSPKPVENGKAQPNKMGSRYMEKPKSVWPDRPDGKTARENYYHRTDEADGLASPFVHKHSQFVAANDPHVEGLSRWSNDYDQYPQRPIPVEPQYTPYEGNYQRGDDQYLPNPLSPEYEGGKNYDGYRREDGPSYWPNQESPQDNTYPVQEYPQPAMHTLNKPNNYPDKESLYAQQLSRTAAQYPEVKHRFTHKPMEISPSMQQNRASEIEEYKSRRYPMHRQPPYMAYEEALEKQLAAYPDMKPKPYEAPHNAEEPMYTNDDLIRASLVNQLPMELDRPHHPNQYERQFENDEEAAQSLPERNEQIKQKITAIEKSRKVPVKEDSIIIPKPTVGPKSVQRTVLDFKMSVTELYQASRTHSQEKNSAILALVMGLTITFLLFIFLACRVKTIRKRMSRKGRALAHDADYLVNGMYL